MVVKGFRVDSVELMVARSLFWMVAKDFYDVLEVQEVVQLFWLVIKVF